MFTWLTVYLTCFDRFLEAYSEKRNKHLGQMGWAESFLITYAFNIKYIKYLGNYNAKV